MAMFEDFCTNIWCPKELEPLLEEPIMEDRFDVTITRQSTPDASDCCAQRTSAPFVIGGVIIIARFIQLLFHALRSFRNFLFL
jgi:hypothetical protein